MMCKLSESIERKFVDHIELDDEWEIETDSGWQPITHLYKTIEYDEWILTLENDYELICADTHIVFDDKLNEIFVKDLNPGDFVSTDVGFIKVKSIVKTDVSSNMFDITVDSPDHRFYTNGILSHNTTTAVALLLHYALFNEHKTIAILANKGDAAKEVLSRIKLAYESLPKWLQQGILEWNKQSIILENGCKIFSGTTTSSSVRGSSISYLYIDECAFIDKFDEFFASVYPTISSGEETKLLFTSTPNGLNHFYKTWDGAINNKNGYAHVKVMWYDVPGRDEKWKEETLQALDYDMEKFNAEYECGFLGSSGTLISGEKLKQLVSQRPINEFEKLKQYEPVIKDHIYTIICDSSKGKGLDYAAFSVIDVTSLPYKQVCTFRDNFIGPVDYAGIIYRIAKMYNEAMVLVELNNMGAQVADVIFMDYGYENLLSTESAGRSGKRVSSGFGKNLDRGIFTSKSVKATGCSLLKLIIEQNQLIINDFNTIEELSKFSKKGASYEAESGANDDLVMGLVLFAWLTDQYYFKEITDINILNHLKEINEQQMEENLLPFGFIIDGADDLEDIVPTARGWLDF